MADQKITQLTAGTTPSSSDLTVTVIDPSGTPANRKVTLGDLVTKAHGLSNTTVIGVSAGLLSSSTTTGSGSVVLSTSPTLVTPTIGVANATSINKVTVTSPSNSSILTLADGSSFITSGNNSVTITSTGTTTVTLPLTGTLTTLAGTETFTNKTIGATGTGTLTLVENSSITLPSLGNLSADGKYSGIVEVGTGGTTIAFGQMVYLKAADSRWYLTKSDATSTSGAVRIAAAAGTSVSGNSLTVLTYGKIRADAKFPTLTIGGPIYLSEGTSGAVVVTQPSATDQVIRIVGYGNTTHEMFFNPDNSYTTHT